MQYQESLLEFACSLNRTDIAQELLELQADPNSANQVGFTLTAPSIPLIMYWNSTDSSHPGSQWDATPLAVAIAARAVETVEVLLQYGASLSQRDRVSHCCDTILLSLIPSCTLYLCRLDGMP